MREDTWLRKVALATIPPRPIEWCCFLIWIWLSGCDSFGDRHSSCWLQHRYTYDAYDDCTTQMLLLDGNRKSTMALTEVVFSFEKAHGVLMDRDGVCRRNCSEQQKVDFVLIVLHKQRNDRACTVRMDTYIHIGYPPRSSNFISIGFRSHSVRRGFEASDHLV